MKKLITITEIEAKFKELIAEYGETTTKDVKDTLRSENYFVTQSQVSNALRENYSEWGAITYDSGNGYKIYALELEEELEYDDDEMDDGNDEDVDDDNDVTITVTTKNTGKKCKIVCINKISTDKTIINLLVPHIRESCDVEVNSTYFDDAQYLISYGDEDICYVGCSETILTPKQARYYAWKVYSEEIEDMLYFDVRCHKIVECLSNI